MEAEGQRIDRQGGGAQAGTWGVSARILERGTPLRNQRDQLWDGCPDGSQLPLWVPQAGAEESRGTSSPHFTLTVALDSSGDRAEAGGRQSVCKWGSHVAASELQGACAP